MAEYFGPKADESIIKFLSTEGQLDRNRIFEEEIRGVFEKLIQGLIFTYKFQKLDDIDTMRDECLTHLYEMLPKFDPARGSKAFSYFNVVARNWFINKSKELRKREKNESDILSTGIDYEKLRHNQNITVKPHEEAVMEKEFWIALSQEMARWDQEQMRPQEREVLDKVIFLFQNAEIISIYSKKAIQIYLCDLTNLSKKQIAASLKRLKEMYVEFRRNYDSGEDAED